MGTKNLNVLQTFNAMRIFLTIYFNKHESADLATMLGAILLRMPYNPDISQAPTIDPASWHDWVNSLKKSLNTHDLEKISQAIITPELAYICMLNYVEWFYQEFHFEDIAPLLNSLKSTHQSKQGPYWQQWLKAVDHAINNTYRLEDFYQ